MGFLDLFRRRAPALPAASEVEDARADVFAAVGQHIGMPSAELGAEVEKAKTKLGELPGGPGFSVYGGWLSSGEKSGDMTGQARWTLDATTKRNVAIVGAGLRRFLEFVGSPRWKVTPWDDTPESLERAEFAEKQLANLATPWRTVVQTGCLARFDGYSIQAWSARRTSDGRIGLADVVSRPCHTIQRWDIDPSGALLGVWQMLPAGGDEHYIERGRMVYYRDVPLTDSPAGVGVMRHIAEPVRELTELRRTFNQGIETDLSGIPVAYAPLERLKKLIGTSMPGGRTYTEADYRADIDGVLSVINNPLRKKNTALLLDSTPHPSLDGSQTSGPRQYELQLLQAGGRAHQVVADRIRAVTWDIAIVLGVEYLLLGADGGGSLAMATAKTLDFYKLVTGTLDGFAEVAQRDLLRPLWALNGWDPEQVGTLTYNRAAFLDPVQVITSVLPALNAGGLPLDRRDLELVNSLLELLGVPTLQDHETDLMLGPRGALADRLGLNRPVNLDGVDPAPVVDPNASEAA